MYTEFSWIAFCLPRGRFSSVKPKQRQAKMQKGRRGAAKRGWVRADGVAREGHRLADGVHPETREAAKRDTSYCESCEKARATGGFLFQFTTRYIIRKARTTMRYTHFSHCSHHARRAHSHGKPRTVGNVPPNSSRGSVESFSSGTKTFSAHL